MASRDTGRLSSGRMDRIVKVEQLTESIDPDSGEPVEIWTTLHRCMPAERIDVSGSERFVANQMAAKYDVVWKVHYCCDLDPERIDVPKTRRLIVNRRVHDIVTAVLLERKAIRLETLAGSAVSS